MRSQGNKCWETFGWVPQMGIFGWVFFFCIRFCLIHPTFWERAYMFISSDCSNSTSQKFTQGCKGAAELPHMTFRSLCGSVGPRAGIACHPSPPYVTTYAVILQCRMLPEQEFHFASKNSLTTSLRIPLWRRKAFCFCFWDLLLRSLQDVRTTLECSEAAETQQ